MSDLEKKIIIKLPALQWRSLLNLRFLLFFSLLLCSFAFVYWVRNIRPFLWIAGAHVESFSAVLHSDIAGRIVEMSSEQGDFVKKGAVLFVLDRDLLLAKQTQAKHFLNALNMQIEKEKNRMGKAMEEYLKASNESEANNSFSGPIEKQLALMEEAQGKSEAAQEQLESAKSELGLLDEQLKKMAFVAPFDGVILKRSKNLGAVVSFGDPVYVLADPDRLWIEAEIPETAIGKIGIGTPAKIRLPAYPKKEWTGKVTYIGPATLAKSSLLPFPGEKEVIPIKISIENRDFLLRPGLSARVGLKID